MSGEGLSNKKDRPLQFISLCESDSILPYLQYFLRVYGQGKVFSKYDLYR
jgi:hypothetical protein